MARRPLQEINAGSMADIAFLLLIFFLVTTTMDTNKGMMRQLPPIVPPEEIKDTDVRERDVFVVLINRADQLLVEGSRMEISELREKTKEFFDNPTNNPNLSDRKSKEIEFFGTVDVSKGVVSLQNDRGTSYDKYIAVQNELVAAVNELRNDLSKRKFGKPFDDLDESQQDAVQKYYPLAISEAEPKTYSK